MKLKRTISHHNPDKMIHRATQIKIIPLLKLIIITGSVPCNLTCINLVHESLQCIGLINLNKYLVIVKVVL